MGFPEGEHGLGDVAGAECGGCCVRVAVVLDGDASGVLGEVPVGLWLGVGPDGYSDGAYAELDFGF